MKKIVSTDQVRQSWINVFLENGYYLMPPASLIPENDDSVNFLNAGVTGLKKYFNSPELLPKRNIVNCQPVIRTLDLDRINYRSYHQTLFDMLGCFSIGGNFKAEVIPLIWNWLTASDKLGLAKERFFITVAAKDQESYSVWRRLGLPEDHILLGDEQTNFWEMGTGPCGFCTEVFYDLRPEKKAGPQKVSDLDDERFIEIGNAVFPEWYIGEDGEKTTLPEKCVDVGVGLDRTTMVVQEETSTFGIDLWKRTIETLKAAAQKAKK